jgi:hypothetical protein
MQYIMHVRAKGSQHNGEISQCRSVCGEEEPDTPRPFFPFSTMKPIEQ